MGHQTPSQRAWRGILMPRGENCRETIFCRPIAAQGSLTAGAILKDEKKPSLVGERQLGGISRDNLGEGNCEPKNAARQWGVNFCREASRCLAGPSGILTFQNGTASDRKREPAEPFSSAGTVGTFFFRNRNRNLKP